MCARVNEYVYTLAWHTAIQSPPYILVWSLCDISVMICACVCVVIVYVQCIYTAGTLHVRMYVTGGVSGQSAELH